MTDGRTFEQYDPRSFPPARDPCIIHFTDGTQKLYVNHTVSQNGVWVHAWGWSGKQYKYNESRVAHVEYCEYELSSKEPKRFTLVDKRLIAEIGAALAEPEFADTSEVLTA